VVVKSGEIYNKRAKSGENTEGVSKLLLFVLDKKDKKKKPQPPFRDYDFFFCLFFMIGGKKW
jgi:hypothetical protein